MEEEADVATAEAAKAEPEAEEEEEESEEEDDEDDEVDDEDEASWPSSLRLATCQRELAQERERCRIAKLAFERAEANLEKAREAVSTAEDDVHDERAKRHRRAERRAERQKKIASVVEKVKAAAPAMEAKAKERKKLTEAEEITELKTVEATAPLVYEGLLTKLRGLASESVTTHQADKRLRLDCLNFLVHCDAVAECKPIVNAQVAGRWFVAVGSSKCVPPAPQDEEEEEESEEEEDDDEERIKEVEENDEEEDLADIDAGEKEEESAKKEEEEEIEPEEEREEESVCLCIAQRSDGSILGAIGWYPLGSLPKDLSGLMSATEQLKPPTRCVRLDDQSWDGELRMLHMTLQGHGEGCKPIVPCGYNLQGSALYHYAASMQHYHLAKAQIVMRLAHGRAAQEEEFSVLSSFSRRAAIGSRRAAGRRRRTSGCRPT